MHEFSYLKDLITLLSTSIFMIAVFKQLKLSPVLGYLIAGAAFGPSGLGYIESSEITNSIAEFGVVFLLFGIGLELTFDKLKSMRKYVIGFGGLQFLPIAILADVIDIETAETGKPRAGAYIAFASMTSKISTALGTFLAIRALSLTNFDATKLADNPAEEILALRILYTIVPALFFLFAILIAWKFPLTAEKHGELQKKIAAHK